MVWEHPVSLVAVYGGFYLFIVFCSLSIACGLYYLAELCEEYVQTTRRLIGYATRAELALHLALLYDRLPPLCLALGFAAHLSYLALLKPFPNIRLSSGPGLLSAGLAAGSTGLWVRHFWTTFYTVEYMAAFLLLTTWLVPGAFFLGISGDYTTLPGAGGHAYTSPAAPQRTPGSSGGPPTGERQRRGFALRIFDAARRARDAVLPRVEKESGLSFKEKL